jgi:outer membrane biosynthesis protein TonB
MSNRQTLQVTVLWQGQVMAYRLLTRRPTATIGDRAGVTFVTPVLSGFPRRFRLLSPVRDGVRLRVGPGMSGKLVLRGKERSVQDLLAESAPKRLLGNPGMFRETELYPGDSAKLQLDPESNLKILISFSDPAEHLPRPRFLPDPLLVRSTMGTAAALTVLLAALRILSDYLHTDAQVMTQERVAKVALQTPPPPDPEEKRRKEAEARKLAEAARKRMEKEAAESKRAAKQEGRIGREDAVAKETVIPKGREDILRAKVARTGVLAVLGSQRRPGSGLAKLFDTTDKSDVEQAMNGLVGVELTAGRGSGGLGNVGSGPGGGGTSFGRIQGSGNLDVGAGRGRGRKGPSLGKGREREVQVGMETGTPDAEGGLTREQINRVVKAHASAIRYCYEKELQRAPSLAGKVELYWVIKPNGTVDRIKVANSSLGSRAVEGCMERQVRNWQFPRSDSETIVQSFPFFFRGTQ